MHTLRETKDAVPDVQVACVTALGLTPLAWSQNSKEDVHAPATPAEARQSTGTASASRETELDCLLALLGDTSGDRWVRAHVPTALTRLAAGAASSTREEIVHALLARLADRSHERDEVVQGCVLALGGLGDADRGEVDVQVRNALKSTVESADLQSRGSRSCRSLGAPRVRVQAARTRARPKCILRGAHVGRQIERARLGRARSACSSTSAVLTPASRARTCARKCSPRCAARVGHRSRALAIAAGLMGDKDATPVLLAKLEHASEASTQGNLAVALGLLATSAPPRRCARSSRPRARPELLRETAIGLR